MKRTFPSPPPGPWAGTVSRTDEGEVVGLVSAGKWAKTRSLVQELAGMLLKVSAAGQKEPPSVETWRGPDGRVRFRWSVGGMSAYH